MALALLETLVKPQNIPIFQSSSTALRSHAVLPFSLPAGGGTLGVRFIGIGRPLFPDTHADLHQSRNKRSVPRKRVEHAAEAIVVEGVCHACIG